ncbi:MAG: hypothetical protein AABX17_02180 [Nanoarchaeota archaeon]
MATGTFLSNAIFQDVILPFLLVFTLVFAILEKSKILGDGKHQINAIIGFVFAAILISFTKYIDWLQNFVIFFVIALFILFIALMLYGFIWGETSGDMLKNSEGLKWTLGIIALLSVGAVALYITGMMDYVKSNPEVVSNVIFIALIVGAIVTVLKVGKDEKK